MNALLTEQFLPIPFSGCIVWCHAIETVRQAFDSMCAAGAISVVSSKGIRGCINNVTRPTLICTHQLEFHARLRGVAVRCQLDLRTGGLVALATQ